MVVEQASGSNKLLRRI